MKVLIVKIGAIGDVIMALSMIPALRRKHPDAKITWMVGRTAAPVLEMISGVDEIIQVNDKDLLTGGLVKKLSALFTLWNKIYLKQYDLIINGHSDPRYSLTYLPAFAKEKYKFNKGTGFRTRPVPGRHHSDEYGMLAENYDGPNDHVYQLPTLKEFIVNTNSAVDGIKKPLIAISPGGAKNLMRDDNLRRWPIENFSLLVQKLIALNYAVVLTGANSDDWVLPYFPSTGIINLIGKLSMPELVQVYSQCSMLITHDSGPLHFSALAGIPVVAIFGPTNPFEKVPRHPSSRILWGGSKLSCRPCYDGKDYAPCTNNICMKAIEVDQVMNYIHEILAI